MNAAATGMLFAAVTIG